MNFPLGDHAALRVSAARADYPGITDYVNLYQLDSTGAPVAKRRAQPRRGVHIARGCRHGRHLVSAAPVCCAHPTPSTSPSTTFTRAMKSAVAAVRRFRFGWLRQSLWRIRSGSIQLEPSDRDLDLVSLEANIDLGFATLTSSTSYYDHSGSSISENTGFYAHAGFLGFYYNYPRPMASAVRTFADESVVQEFRLVTDDGGNLITCSAIIIRTKTSSLRSRAFCAASRDGGTQSTPASLAFRRL